MTDIVSRKKRSEIMARIRGRDTAPELVIRRIAHGMGLRFRLQGNDLPGRPDLVFPKYRLAVFVHGCFWHRHHGCRFASNPKTRVAFWNEKFAANVARDARQEAALKELDWRILVIWECETKDEAVVEQKLRRFIDRRGAVNEQESNIAAAPIEVQCSIAELESLARPYWAPSGSDAMVVGRTRHGA